MINTQFNSEQNNRELKLIEEWLMQGHKSIKFKIFKPITISNFEIISKTNGDVLFLSLIHI